MSGFEGCLRKSGGEGQGIRRRNCNVFYKLCVRGFLFSFAVYFGLLRCASRSKISMFPLMNFSLRVSSIHFLDLLLSILFVIPLSLCNLPVLVIARGVPVFFFDGLTRFFCVFGSVWASFAGGVIRKNDMHIGIFFLLIVLLWCYKLFKGNIFAQF